MSSNSCMSVASSFLVGSGKGMTAALLTSVVSGSLKWSVAALNAAAMDSSDLQPQR
jgi:hypothetical protein